MPTLTSQKPQNTYPFLLWVDQGIHATTQRNVLDGDGTSSALYLASNGIKIDGYVASYGADDVGQNSVDLQFSRDKTWMVAKGDYSFLTGKDSSAYGYASFSYGNNCHATGKHSHCGGYNSISSGEYSWAHGYKCYTGKEYTCNIVGSTVVVPGGAIDFPGYDADDISSIYIYTMTGGSGNTAQSFKVLTAAPGDNISYISSSLVITIDGNLTHTAGKVVLGRGFSHAEGYGTIAFGKGGHSSGIGTYCEGEGAFAGGLSDYVFQGNDNAQHILAAGLGAFAFGYSYYDSGLGWSGIISESLGSVALGYAGGGGDDYLISATGYGSFAGGYANTTNITASNQGSFAYGTGDITSSGVGSVAIGYNLTSSGNYSFSSGRDNLSSAACSETGNRGNQATGQNSFARNLNNIASGTNSSCFGEDNESVGQNSVCMGYKSKSNRPYEFTIGNNALESYPRQASRLVLHANGVDGDDAYFTDGVDERIPVLDDSVCLFIVNVVGSDDNDMYAGIYKFLVKKFGGVTTIVGTPVLETLSNSLTIVAEDGTVGIKLKVNGVSGTVRWAADVTIVESYATGF